MAAKFVKLFAAASLAVISSSYGPLPVNALSVESHGSVFSRSGVSGHHEIAKKRSIRPRATCRARPSAEGATVATSDPQEPAQAASSPESQAESQPEPQPEPQEGHHPEPEPQAPEPETQPDHQPESQPNPSAQPNNPSPVTTPSGKAGLAWPNGPTGKLNSWKTDHVSMLYSWSSWPVQEATDLGMNVFPMLWGHKDIGDFVQNIDSYAPTWVLGFNEPNESGQSNMSPDAAVELWWQYMEPLKAKGHTLGAPAVSGSPEGFEWTKEFFAKCQGCHIDILPTHWYDVKKEDFIAYQEKFHNEFNLPILVTEFACQNFNDRSDAGQCSPDQIYDFMNTVTTWMDSTDWILGYFYFGAMQDMFNVNYDNRMMGDDGTPNDLGRNFIRG